MKVRTINYNIRQGFHNIAYHKMFSFASIATMTACIFLFGLFYSVVMNFQATVRTAEEGVAVTVFFEKDLPQDNIDAICGLISKRPEVSSRSHFVSADEAWETFKADYFKGKEELAEGFADDNPLANCANYEIYMNDISMQTTLVSYIEDLDGVREVHKSEVAANTLSDLNRLISYISIAIIAILIIVATFLISNTIAVGISVHKDEIAIMKYVGAKDSFVRGPYIVEGLVTGFVGAVIPLVILYFLYGALIDYITDKFVFLEGIITFVPVKDVFTILVPVAILLGIGIGFVGSKATVRKHLKV